MVLAGLLAIVSLFVLPVSAQDVLTLCREGKRNDVLPSLQMAVKTSPLSVSGEAWNCLGLAFYETDRDIEALKAFQKAIGLAPDKVQYRVNLAHVQLMNRKIDSAQSNLKKVLKTDPNNASALYLAALADTWEAKMPRALETVNRLIATHPGYANGYILKGDIKTLQVGIDSKNKYEKDRYAEVLAEVVSVLRDGRAKITDAAEMKKIDAEIVVKNIFAEYFAREPLSSSDAPPEPKPGVTPLKILSKQKAQYTDRARSAGIQGTIMFAVLFTEDGKIAETVFLKRLGYGLDEQALSALRKITFEPQKQDGKPVSVIRSVQYTFNIY